MPVQTNKDVIFMKIITVDDRMKIENLNHSSKGDQPKWLIKNQYYKADHMGYESLSEYLVSELLKNSNITNFVEYTPVTIKYNGKELIGCESKNFLKKDEELFTFKRLHRAYTGKELYKTVWQMNDVKDRIAYTVDFIEKVTDLKNVGKYLTAIAEIDMLFLNEDRHFNNLSVIRNQKNEFRLSPIFDNGLSFFSDTKIDYPLGTDIYQAISKIKAKPFSTDFDTQTDILEQLYGTQLTICTDKNHIRDLIDDLTEFYPADIISRVTTIVLEQMRRYGIYFSE